VSNIPSAGTGNALSCAEHALFLMLALLRDVAKMNESLDRRWLGVPAGETLYGKTVLIIGFGNIARELIPRLKPFGVRLLAIRRSAWASEGPKDVQTARWDSDCLERGPAVERAIVGASYGGLSFGQTNGLSDGRASPDPSEPCDGPAAAPSGEIAALLDGRGRFPEDVASLAASADFVVLTCPQNAETRGMVDERFLASCKPGVRIINVARGAPRILVHY
jgi:phosphoglycerate dehydrogenase-like enzyme